MNLLLFRFEKTKIHYVSSRVMWWELSFEQQKSICLDSYNTEWDKYKGIYDELTLLEVSFPNYQYFYHLPSASQSGVDHIRFANEAILQLFCSSKWLTISKLYRPDVHAKLSITSRDLKALEKSLPTELNIKYAIAKTHKLMDWIVYLHLLKEQLNG
jgi:hypothetical protein